MIGVSHIIMHVGLCAAIARVAPETTIAMRVQVLDKANRPQVDKVYKFQRGDEAQTIIEFDSQRGIYVLLVSVPKYRCAAVDYLYFIADHQRNISEQLVPGPYQHPQPMLMQGTAPQSFLYVQPTFVVLSKSIACNQPVTQPMSANINVENDQDSYYVWMYADAALLSQGPVQLALQMKSATGLTHYLRVPMDTFPLPWDGWPVDLDLNISDDVIDNAAGKPPNVLLCPKFYKTSVGG